MRDPPPKAPPSAMGAIFGSAFSAAVMAFEYIEEPADDRPTTKGLGPSIVIQPMPGENGPAQLSQHGRSIHGHDIDFVYVPHPTLLPERIHIARKRFRSDTSGVIQIDLPTGSGTAIANFIHVFHNLPGHQPNWAPLPNLSAVADGLSKDGVYTATFWGGDWAIQSVDSDGASGSRAARAAQASNQRACFTATGDACAGTASLTCYQNQDRCSWETYDLQDAVVEPNVGDGAVSLTFSAVDSDG